MMLNIGAFDPALLGEWRPVVEATPDGILGLVSVRFRTPLWRLTGRQRGQHIAFVRQIAMYVLRECTDLSFPVIGFVFRRDHSTAIHGCKIVKARMAEQPAFRARIEALMAEIEG